MIAPVPVHCFSITFINNLKFLSIHSDGWFAVRFSRCWLVYYLNLFCANCELKVVTCFLTCGLQPLAFFPLIWYFLPGHLHRGAYQPHLPAPWIWLAAFLGSAIKAVPDWKTSINVLKSICEHSRKHHTEQCWCHNTALFDSVCHRKWFRVLSIILNACLHAVMKLPHHCYVSGWTTKLCHYFSKPITTDCVKCFG